MESNAPLSHSTALKINAIFAHLDSDHDGFITYRNMFDLLNPPCSSLSFSDPGNMEATPQEQAYQKSQFLRLLYSPDSVHLSAEDWYYMSDVLYPLQSYLSDTPSAVEHEQRLRDRHLQCSHYSPLYRTQGWSLQQLTDAYVKYQFFDVEHHHNLVTNNASNKQTKRVYNLLTQVALNAPSTALIVREALATGKHLYVHILDGDEDPDRVTWEKLAEIHEKMGTIDVLERARQKEEILPQDVLYYDPEQCTSGITSTIPDYSVFWHAVFENQMQDLPDFIIQDYFDTVVRPDIEANNDGMFVEPKHAVERDKMIEEHVYNEMEKHMQDWCWKRFAQVMLKPVYSMSTWTEHNLIMNAQD